MTALQAVTYIRHPRVGEHRDRPTEGEIQLANGGEAEGTRGGGGGGGGYPKIDCRLTSFTLLTHTNTHTHTHTHTHTERCVGTYVRK